MNGPEREALDRLARRLRREHFNRIHNHEKDTMHEDHENMTRAELIERLKAAEIGRETYRRLLIESGHPLTQPEAQPHPLAQIAANMHKPVTVAGDLIEDVDGLPYAVTESFTAPVIGMVITAREATEAGIDPRTPGVTIVDNETGAVISRGEELEDEQL